MESFDRITYTCRLCKQPALISSVAASITRLAIDGFCPVCRQTSRVWIDLLELDYWLTQAEEGAEQSRGGRVAKIRDNGRAPKRIGRAWGEPPLIHQRGGDERT